MEFKYLKQKDSRNLIKDMFILSFSKKVLPFKTIILPLAFPTLVYIFSEQQKTIFKGIEMPLKGLTLTGQFYGAYDYFVNDVSSNIGMTLHPTALYKILNKDISLITNKHILFKEISIELAQKLEPIFLKYKDNLPQLEKEIIQFIENLDLTIDNDVKYIDKAIEFIFKEEGLTQVKDLLKIIPFSLKSLELKFQKIIGLTPKKFIKMIRFNKLIIKYQSNEIELKDLIYKYNYYDQSHFSKDFKLFMNQSPKLFFKQDYPLLKEYLKEY